MITILALSSPIWGLLGLLLSLVGVTDCMRGLLRLLSWLVLVRRLTPLAAQVLFTELAARWLSADSKGASLLVSGGGGVDSSSWRRGNSGCW